MHVRYDTKDIPMPLIGHPRPPTPFSGPVIKDRIGLAMVILALYLKFLNTYPSLPFENIAMFI